MLQFIFGRAASGKTFLIHELIKREAADKNNNLILLVPEQYTFETEKAMLSLLGDGFMSKVNVLSFTRMCETVGQLYGGIAGIRVTEAQRMILLGNALKNLSGNLQIFKRYVGSATFISQLALVIGEFKTAGVSSSALIKAAKSIDNMALADKITEIALIYAEYDNLLKGIYIDPLDELEVLYNKAVKHPVFKDKTIYIDAFKGFTGEQLKILKLMIAQAKKVVISLCSDGEDKHAGVGVFSNICATAELLKRYAADGNISVADPIILKNTRHEKQELKILENLLAGESVELVKQKTSFVTYATFETPLQELEYVFKKIHFLVRNENYRYEDFVLIARDISRYERRISLTAEKFEVPYYLDKRRSLINSPFARFVISLLNAAKSLDSESIFSMLKTGFFKLTDDEICKLEEYVYIWGIDKKAWLDEWQMEPNGLKESDLSNVDELKNVLAGLNDIRKRVVLPLIGIKKSFDMTVPELTKAVYELIIKLKCDQTLKEYCEALFKNNCSDDADFLMDSWDAVMGVFDDMVRCYGDEKISADEYLDMLKLAFSENTLGTIPRMIDEVTCGSADRIRPSRPKVVFVIGMNQGEFPASAIESGILLKSDRIGLEKAGIEISDQFRRFAIDERFLAYSSICSASERVYILRHAFEFDGTSNEESTVFSKIKKTFPECEYNNTNVLQFPETAAEGFDILASNFNCDSDEIASLNSYFLGREDYKWRVDALLRAKQRLERRLSKQTLKNMFSNDINLSASKLEVYHKCPFSYFCKYVLKLSRLQKAELDNLQRGTIVHHVLEKVLSDFGAKIADAAKSEITQSIHTAMTEYLEKIHGFEYLKIPRFEFLFGEIEKMLMYLIVHISNEFKNSDFVPAAYELDISDDGAVPALRLEFSDGKHAVITGQIDRVDVLKDNEGNEFVRVVDYKTGKKSFYLSDVLYGLNLQMLLYLYILRHDIKTEYGKKKPAGILYMPSNRGMIGNDGKDPLVMNGMLLDDEKVLKAMDKAELGCFVPKRPTRERASDPMISSEEFEAVFEYLELKIKNAASNISNGIFDLCPRNGTESRACKYCDFKHVCGIEDDFEIAETKKLSSSMVIEKMREAETNVN